MTDAQPIPAGLTPERVGFFTDAVFAIAMTLLVIEIPRPEAEPGFAVGDGVGKAEAAGNLLRFLSEQSGSFVAYSLAFYLLWNAWRRHHRLFDSIDRLSPSMVRWHFPFLLVIGFLPYPTTVFGHHTGNPAAALLFTLAVGALMITRAGVQWQAVTGDLLAPGVDPARFRRDAWLAWAVAGYWLATVVLAPWTPWIIVAWSSTPLVAAILHRRARSAGQ